MLFEKMRALIDFFSANAYSLCVNTFSDTIAAQNDLFYLRVKILPGAPKTLLKEQMADGETWKISVAALAEKGRANKELQKYFRKEFGLLVRIISGGTSRVKLLKCQK